MIEGDSQSVNYESNKSFITKGRPLINGQQKTERGRVQVAD